MINIIYWSQTGNTAAMAEAIAEGVKSGGGAPNVKEVSLGVPGDLENEPVFALGCPAMGDEVLEEDEMEPFVDGVCKFAKGKKIALFGSYGWGDGEWMRDWEEKMKAAGAEIIGGAGLIVNDLPDDDGIAECKALGEALAKA